MSLHGRTVVITRATEQSDATVEVVESFGAKALVVPLIEVVDDPVVLAELAAVDLGAVDWVVVTSPNGAERVAALLPVSAPPQVAAVGAATAAALPRCDLVPRTQSAAGLLEEMPTGDGRVVVVQAFHAAATLVDGLRRLGWQARPFAPYRTQSVRPTAAARRAALAADAVLLASGSAARAWVEAFGQHTPPVVVAIGEQTAAAAEAGGLKVHAIAADHSVYGMLVTLSRYLDSE
jgi:uroporphyrinogen-III synthase